MQVLADDGARIDVRVAGRKHDPAVVLIHGFPLTNAIWETQADALAQSFYVLVPDLRGAGSSSAPDGPYLMERLAADIAASLDALGIERAALVGHSMGGYVALAFARMFTERLTGLALVASRIRADIPEEASARGDLARRVESDQSSKAAIEAYLPRLFAPETLERREDAVRRAYAIAQANGPIGVAATLRGMALRSSSEDIAQELDIPALVVSGARDLVVGADEARCMAQTFPKGEFVACERSGHLPMLEEPQCVTESLRDWMGAVNV